MAYHYNSFYPGRRYESHSRDHVHRPPDMKYSRLNHIYTPRHRRQASWPPFPTVEDLSEAKAKEHDHHSLDENAGDEVVNRGSIDQEPVLLEVEEEMSKMNRERRFVLVPGAAGDADRRSDVPIRKDAACDDAHISRTKQTLYSKPDLVRVQSGDALATKRSRRLERSGGDISDSDLEDQVPLSRPARFNSTEDRIPAPYSSLRGSTYSYKPEPSHPREERLSVRTTLPRPDTPPKSTAGLTPQAMLTGDLPWSRPLPLRRSTCETLYGSGRNNASRPASPLARDDLPPSPPRSPRPKDEVRSRVDPRSVPAPRQGSRNASRGGSPLSASFDLPRVESPELNARSSTFPLSSSPIRSRPPSRHGRDAMREEFRADMQPSARLPAAGLPYPDDDAHQLMPSEEHFQFFPSPTRPFADYAARLPIPSRLHDEFRRPAIRRTHSDTDATRRSKDELPSGPLPPCPRPDYTTKYNDWYTLDGALTLDICPDCVDNVVRRSPFRREFKRVVDMEPEYPKKCALGDPWFRIAWLLALQEKRDDLALMRALAAVNNDEKPCPDKHRAHRAWFSLPNRFGDGFISNLHVCQHCVRCVDVLMPSLRGVWQREPPSVPTPTKHLCTLRTSSRRFPKYLDALLDVHAAAQRARGPPDLAPFADLAQANAWKAECQRDTPLLDAMWHVIPGVPELTICEECYDDVVWPAARGGSKLASLVTGALQYVEGAHEVGVVGADSGDAASETKEGRSCQLYSARMRRAWARACRDEDAGLFLRRVRERRQAEREIGARYRRIKMYLEDVEKAGGGREVERLKEELDRCRREWKEWE